MGEFYEDTEHDDIAEPLDASTGDTDWEATTGSCHDGVTCDSEGSDEIDDDQPDVAPVPAPLSDAVEVSDVPADTAAGEAAGEPETAREPAHPVVEMMDKLHAERVLGDEQTRDEVLGNADTATVKQVLNAVNGTVRGLPPEQWGMDGRGHIQTEAELMAGTPDYQPPAHKDREPLMDKALETAKGLPAEHAGTLTGLAINATHAYNDGCGRTSRWAYTARTHGYDGSQADREKYDALLGETSGRSVVNLDQSRMDLPGKYAREDRQRIADEHGYEGKIPTGNWGGYDAMIIDDEHPETLLTRPEIPPAGRVVLDRVIQDPHLGPNAMMQHVLQSGGDPSEYIRTSPNGQRTFVDLDKLVPTLSVDDIKSIARAHRAMSRGYVEDLIDTFGNPERRDEAQAIVDFYRPPRD